MSKQVQIPEALLGHVLAHVNFSSLALKKALDEVSVHRAVQTKAAAMRPTLVDHMVTSGVVVASQKQAAEAMLGDLASAYGLVKAANDKIVELKEANAKLAAKLAQAGISLEPGGPAEIPSRVDGATTKQAGSGIARNSTTGSVVGARSSEISESDLPLMKLAGMAT